LEVEGGCIGCTQDRGGNGGGKGGRMIIGMVIGRQKM